MSRLIFLLLMLFPIEIIPQSKLNISNSNRIKEFVVPYVESIGTNSDDVDTTFNKHILILEISSLLDSIREHIYQRKLMVTKIDYDGNKGCEHHCNYLKNIYNINRPDFTNVGHGEVMSDSKNRFKYTGKDTLIDNWGERHLFFAKKDPNNYMFPTGEVCLSGSLTSISRKGMSHRDIARKIIYNFYGSTLHWNTLTSLSYCLISSDIQFKNHPDGSYIFWFTLVTGVKEVTTKKSVKNKMFYPGNPLGFTEYYDSVTTEIICNR